MTPAYDQSIMNIDVKRAVKILGVYLTYDRSLRHKLNFKEIIDAIKTKLQLCKWRNLTIIAEEFRSLKLLYSTYNLPCWINLYG